MILGLPAAYMHKISAGGRLQPSFIVCVADMSQLPFYLRRLRTWLQFYADNQLCRKRPHLYAVLKLKRFFII